MGEIGPAASGFDFVGDPVVVAHTLQRHRGSWRKLREKSSNGTRLMIDPHSIDNHAMLVLHGEK
jgi:hypothetical protein